MQLRMLGGLEVTAGGAVVELGPPKQRAVLAVLLAEAGRVVPAERLVDLLWGEDAPKAAASLQAYVSNLRRALEPGRRPRDPATVLVTQAPGYRLVVERSAVDALRFEDLAAAGRDALAAGEPARALPLLEEALALWSGPPLPELASEPFAVDLSARLLGIRAAALHAAAEARLALGDHGGAIAPLEEAVAEHPLDERLAGLLVLALYRAGRQADALRALERARRALVDTAGLEPGPELRRLEADVLAQSPGLDWRAPTTADEADEPAELSALVGRAAELRTLVDALESARGGKGSAVVVLGEPGIGKTRLVEELAAQARAAGVVTAWARCPESGAVPPYWPCVKLGDDLRAAGVIIDRLLAPPPGEQQATSRFGLHRAVVTSLTRMPSPVLLVLDDLQWADADSLRLLEHVAADIATMPVLVVVTTRPLEETSPPVLVECLAELTRSPGATHLSLAGLDAGAVAEWLDRRTDVDVPGEVVDVVHDRTAGNPLFVKELCELLAAEGHLADAAAVRSSRVIPAGVQFVVRRRVARLDPPTQQLLSAASVVGRSFDLDVVAAVTGSSLDTVLDELEPALGSGLVVDGDEPGSFRFSHALVADALAAEVNAARRARIHAAAGRALDARGADAAVVAHHAILGHAAGTAELAVAASVRAARLAESRLALEDAAAHWGRAADVLRRGGDRSQLVAVLIERGNACFRAELVRAAKDAVAEAVEVAAGLGDLDGMVKAASLLCHAHVWPNEGYGNVDIRAVASLEQTLAALPPDRDLDRARLLSALALELAYSPDVARRQAVGAEAEAVARATGDPETIARTLLSVIQPLPPGEADRRKVLCEEVIDLTVTHRLPDELELVATFNRASVDYLSADFDAARTRLVRSRQLVDGLGGLLFRSQQDWFEAALAIPEGRFDEADRLGERAYDLYRRTRNIDALIIDVARRMIVAADIGGLEELIDMLWVAGGESPAYQRSWAEFLAWTFLEVGRRDDAIEVVETFPSPAALPLDWSTLGVGTIALHVRAELGDVDGTAALLPQLEPFSGCWGVMGTGTTAAGLVDLGLARGFALVGEADRAEARFASAVAGHERLRARAWLARSLCFQGRFLLDRQREPEGRAALARASELAEAHGLVYVRRRLEGLQVTAK